MTTPHKILVFEDNPVNQIVTRKLLERAGYAVEVAENGVVGLHLYGLSDYDAVIMDIMMPEMDGYEATRQIRALPAPKGQVPIIALTANASVGDRDKCLSIGMNDYIAKPFNPDDLYTALKQQLKNK